MKLDLKVSKSDKFRDYIFIQTLEDKGRTKSSILSDAFEAIMGTMLSGFRT